MTSAPGKTFLLVAGISSIIFGSISVVMSLNGLFNLDRTIPTAIDMSWSVYYTIILIGALFRILVGIMGIAYCKHLEKAALLKTLGIIYVVYTLFYGVLTNMIIYGNITDGFVVSLAIALIIPTLYILGAQKNLTAYTESQ